MQKQCADRNFSRAEGVLTDEACTNTVILGLGTAVPHVALTSGMLLAGSE
jgi:hypothetical protein